MCDIDEEGELFTSCALASRRLSGVERSCGAAESCQPHQLSLQAPHTLLTYFKAYLSVALLSSLCPEGLLLWLIPCSLTWDPVTVTLLWRRGHWQCTLPPCVPQCVVSCEEMKCHELSWAELLQRNSSLKKSCLPQLHEAKLNGSWEIPRTPVNFYLIRFSISLVS